MVSNGPVLGNRAAVQFFFVTDDAPESIHKVALPVLLGSRALYLRPGREPHKAGGGRGGD